MLDYQNELVKQKRGRKAIEIIRAIYGTITSSLEKKLRTKNQLVRECSYSDLAIHILLNPKYKFVWTEGMFRTAVRHFKALAKETMLFQMGFKLEKKRATDRRVFIKICNLVHNLKSTPKMYIKRLSKEFLNMQKNRIKKSLFYNEKRDGKALKACNFIETLEFVLKLTRRIINSVRNLIYQQDTQKMDKRFPNYLVDTETSLLKSLEEHLIHMEYCQRVLAQFRFDILCQYGQLEDVKLKDEPLNFLLPMQSQMLYFLKDEYYQRPVETLRNGLVVENFALEQQLDYDFHFRASPGYLNIENEVMKGYEEGSKGK